MSTGKTLLVVLSAGVLLLVGAGLWLPFDTLRACPEPAEGTLPARQAPATVQLQETRSDGAIPLTTPPAGASDQNPAFSPDGTRIVFTRFENGYNIGPAGLFVLNLGTGQGANP